MYNLSLNGINLTDAAHKQINQIIYQQWKKRV